MASDRITLKDAAKRLAPLSGKPVSYSTMRRWTAKGVQGVNGKPVVLRKERIGGRYYTRIEWLEEFLALCNGQRRCDLTRQRTRHGKSAARKQLEQEFGFHGEKSDLPDMQPNGVCPRAVPPVLHAGEVRDTEPRDDSRGVGGGGPDGAEGANADGRLPLSVIGTAVSR